jgi:hypothetical protein
MNHWKNTIAAFVLIAFTATTAHAAQPAPLFGKKDQSAADQNLGPSTRMTAEQSALLDKALAREKLTTKVIADRSPLIETYVQIMRPDQHLQQVPDSDIYMLNRVDLHHGIGQTEYRSEPKKNFFVGSLEALGGITKALKFEDVPGGYTSMLMVDPEHLDRAHYSAGFVKREFLGSVRCSVYDLQPKGNGAMFLGRIWVEEQDGTIVRFNGSFGHSHGTNRENDVFHHFDSWRTNVQPGVWLPTAIYIENTSTDKHGEHYVDRKAVSHIWGYVLKVPSKGAENVTITADNATDASTNNEQDVSPLGSERAWVQQAEDNVIERLQQAGLVDSSSDFDKTLEQIANNILIENNVAFSGTVHVRTLLTSTLESASIGNTILLSKGLQDTMFTPSDDGKQAVANLATILSFQLAHIILGHRIDTRYAFNDHLLFPDSATFVRIPMGHTEADNVAAAKKAMDLMAGSEFKDRIGDPGLYFLQLQQRAKNLPGLLQPRLGDGLAYGAKDKRFFLEAATGKAPKLNMEDVKQEAAMPLGSLLRIDPWTDRVIQLHYAAEAPLNGRDKMPFEVTPIYYRLSYYKDEGPNPLTQGAADPNAAPAGAQQQNVPAPAGATPANGPAQAAAPGANQ